MNVRVEIKIEDFYKKYFDLKEKSKRLSLEAMQELKKEGITTEQFLDYLCQKQGLLLHGSIHQVKNSKLISENNKIFASNKSAIAIMRSIYSNVGVNLKYPYFIDKNNPLILELHAPKNGKFVSVKRGFVYVLDKKGFKNDPKGSWQFVKESSEADFVAVIETQDKDFTYPVEIFNDFDLKQNKK